MIEKICERFLLAVAVAKLLLLAAFILSFGPASASLAADSVCRGENLIEKLRAEDPEKLANIRQEAVKALNADSIFWKIEKAGVSPSYLLGTMHMSDPQVTRLSPQAKAALEQAQKVVIESTETLDPQKAAAAMAQLQHLTFLTQGKTVDALLSDELTQRLQQAVEARSLPFQIANRLQPWVIATMIAVPVCELEAKRSGKKILDHVIAQHALDNNKELIGLETTEEQFMAIAGLPASFHLAALKETLAIGNGQVESIIATMKALYRTGEIGMLMPLMRAVSPEAYAGQGSAEFQQALITKRNKIMAERANAILNEGSAFLAVGALHLPGKAGLVSLLRADGFTVQAVR